MIGVLFVCTGNICRSPTAAAVFRRYAEKAGLENLIQVDSAGIAGYHIGEPPDSRAVQAALRRGFSMKGLIARQVRREDFAAFDYILAMDEGHFAALERARPRQAKAVVSMFLDHAPQISRRDVPDPYYGAADHFEEVLDLVEQGAAGFLEYLQTIHPELKNPRERS